MQKRENENSLLVWENNFNCTNLSRHAKSAYHKRVGVESISQPITIVVAHARNKAELPLYQLARMYTGLPKNCWLLTTIHH